jgi:hypothetical protein
MSALYLIERHAQPDSSIDNSDILDVQESTQPLLPGRFVVKVPDGVPINKPTNLGDLITKKAQGFLIFYAGFTRVTYDDLIDTSNVDFVNSQGIVAGHRGCLVLEPGGTLQSLPTTLTSPAPEQAFVTWDTYQLIDSDPYNGMYSRQYNELPSDPAHVTCNVAFDGATFNSTTDSALVNIQPFQAGTSFIIQLTNVTTSRLSIGSWAVIY